MAGSLQKSSERRYLVFADYKKLPYSIPDLFDKEGFGSLVKKGKEVLIKIHPGEPVNYTYIHPSFVREVVKKVKSLGGKPVITETTTLYRRARFEAGSLLRLMSENGFGFCELRVADAKGGVMAGGYEVAKEIYEADSMIVLSHSKGHLLAGYGGAIKQLGMGCLTKEGKRKVHEPCRPIVSDSCIACGTCARECPFGNISIGRKAEIDYELCCGCGTCISACPRKAITRRKDWQDNFLRELAKGARAVINTFDEGKIGYMNFLVGITKWCDCTHQTEILCPDIGAVISKDIIKAEEETARHLSSHVPTLAKFARRQAALLKEIL